ncbi:MAG: diguanylate cyclase [Rhodocyclaceae bacterium]|nr:diguanylate cyclase [Rhodocyclaceae bacterium]
MIDPLRYAELKASGRLPSPAGMTLALIEKLRRDDVKLTEISRLIQADPVLTGRLLKLANAAVYARPRPVAAVTPEVLMMLGLPAVRNLVLAFALIDGHRSCQAQRFDCLAFWSCALAEACAAQAIAARLRVAPAAEMFTLGLIADIGRLALASWALQRYDAILDQAGRWPDATHLAEEEAAAFGFDHAELGSAMASEWGLPKLFQEAIRWHALPESLWPFGATSRTAQLTATLRLAHRLAETFLLDDEARSEAIRALREPAAALGITDLLALADETLATWRDWGELLALTTRPLVPFVELAARPPEAAKNLRVVVVEDDGATRRLLEGVLAKAGFSVRTAAHGEEGLAIIRAWLPELVVTDIVMPGMSGLELIQTLRYSEEGGQYYIVVITVLDAIDKLIEAFSLGADDYVVKPLDARVLLARLQAGVRVTRLRQTLVERNLELAEALRRAEEAALTDALTGLPNRRYAMQRLEQECAAAERGQRPLSILMIDIDHFKPINDSMGHDAGDKVLQEVATRLRSAARLPDVVCRIGGEEFLILAVDTPLAAASQLAERIRLQVASRPIVVREKSLDITISIGVAEKMATCCHGVDRLLKCADDALYLAKAAGRNAVRMAEAGG